MPAGENTLRVSVVQATPVLFNRDQTVEKLCGLVAECGRSSSGLVVFPEAFIPGYPRGLGFGTVIGSRSDEGRRLWQHYFEHSIEIPGPETVRIGEAVKRAGCYLVVGVTERDPITRGTLYCTLVYFAPSGEVLGIHRKLKPTAAERIIWGEGDGSTLEVFPTEFGRLSGLVCWENLMPLARTALYQQGVEIYVAPTADARDGWQATLGHIALEGRCFVIGCNQFVRKADYPPDLPGIEDLEAAPEIMCRGGSAIYSPLGQCLGGPLYDGEGVVSAELDLGALTRARLDFDVAGHYARDDVFELRVHRPPES